MKTLFSYSKRIAFALSTAGMLLACSKDNGETAAPQAGVQLNNTSLGNVLTDETGRTLYFFSNDFDGNSACTGNCLTAWPVFYRQSLTLSAGLNETDFTTITRTDGSKQTVYKGWPLYYYKDDPKPGDVTGENVNNVWFVAKPTYTLMLTNTQLIGHDGKTYTNAYQEGTGKTLFFVDGQGRTLYAFKNDKNNKNNFTKTDFSNNAVWPLYEASLGEIPSTLDKSLFGSITVAGHSQLTYKGWPLYYFGQDAKRGDTKGVSFPSPGVWPIVQKDTPTAPQ